MKKTLILIVLLFAVAMLNGCVNIEPGEVGVRKQNFPGKVSDKPLTEGWRIKVPWLHEVWTYDIKRRTRELEEETYKVLQKELPPDDSRLQMIFFNSKDGQNVWCDVMLEYSLIINKVPLLHKRLGKNYWETLLRPKALNVSRNIISTYEADELFHGTEREAIEQKIEDKLNEELAKEGIEIHSVLLKHFMFTDEYQSKIEQTQILVQELAIQQQQEEVINQENRNILAKQKGIAEAEGQARIIAAQKKAEALKMEADGKKQSNILIAEGKKALYEVESDYMADLARGLNGGENVAKVELAKNIAENIQVWGIPTGSGDNGMGLLGLFGIMGGMDQAPVKAPSPVRNRPRRNKTIDETTPKIEAPEMNETE